MWEGGGECGVLGEDQQVRLPPDTAAPGGCGQEDVVRRREGNTFAKHLAVFHPEHQGDIAMFTIKVVSTKRSRPKILSICPGMAVVKIVIDGRRTDGRRTDGRWWKTLF